MAQNIYKRRQTFGLVLYQELFTVSESQPVGEATGVGVATAPLCHPNW